jgi:DNA repair exonuclease SbcCD nuclease subunit
MTTCIAIGDCHFKTTNVIQTSAMIDKIVKVCIDKKPDFIVMLGDTLDRHETIHVDPLSRATCFLFELCKIAPTYLIIGNHDRPNNSDFLSDKHPFTGLKYLNNLHIVDKVVHNKISDFNFTFVPYVPPSRFIEALQTIDHDYKNNKCIFAHQEFKGAKMGAIESQDGDIWETSLPLVVSGHIHDYDELQNNLIYTGTPIQHSFGDKEDKTISYFTFNNDSFTHQRIDLGLPKKRLIYLDYKDFLSLNPNNYNSKDEVKMVVRGSSAELKTLIKSNTVKMLEMKGVKVSYKEITGDKNEIKTEVGIGYHEQLMVAVAGDIKLTQLLYRLFGPLKLKI